MTVKLNSYISFQGNAKEAMEFYKGIFGGELFMDTMDSYADKMPVSEEDKGKIMHAYLKGNNGIELMGSDTPAGMQYDSGARISLTLNGDDETTLRLYWDKLAEDGTVMLPLDKAPWGDMFGLVTDKYGVNWMIDIGPVQ